MSGREDIIEKYRRELMKMHRKAVPEQEEIPVSVPDTEEVVEEHKEHEEQIPESETKEEEKTYEENEQTDTEVPICSLCAGGIALCEFFVEEASSGRPIEYAQIMIHRADGFFIRVLTDESGKTCEIPLFAEHPWRVSITAQGYVPVSKAPLRPVSGERLSIPVRLDESLSLDSIFTEHNDSITAV